MAIEIRKVGRPFSKSLSREDLNREIERLAGSIEEQKLILKKLEKEREWNIAELFSRHLGLVKGQTYDLMLNGKQRKGKFIGVKKQISSYMLQREYVLEFMVAAIRGFQEVRRVVLPSQVIGLEALNLEELDQIFKEM